MAFRTSIVFLSVVLSVCAFAKPPDEISREDIRKTELHRNQLVQALKEELDHEKADHLIISNSLAKASDQNVILQKKIDRVTDDLNFTQGKLDKAMKKLWWYRWHWWLSWIVLGVGAAISIIFGLVKYTAWGAAKGAKFGL